MDGTTDMTSRTMRHLFSALLLGSATLMSACAPLVLGSAVGSALMITDRRTSGTLVEDQGIEIKAANRLAEVMDKRNHVSVTAYNRVVLLTGEVSSEAERLTAEQVVAGTENVKSVINELIIGGASSLTSRSSDLWVLSKVKATFVDARDIQANAFKVVVERSEVYLMGMVTEREAKRAAELAASVKGVQKVVKVLHIITEDELARKQPSPPASSSNR